MTSKTIPSKTSNRAVLFGQLQSAVMNLRSAGVLSNDHASRIARIAEESLRKLESEIIETRSLVLQLGHAISSGTLTEGRSFIRSGERVLVHPEAALRELHEKRVLREFPWGAQRLLQRRSQYLPDLVSGISVRAVVGGHRCRCIALLPAALLAEG